MTQWRATDIAVDIVIDNHNYGAFLPKAIDSACRQTHGRINVIVVDDGSTDDSSSVLDRYEGTVTVVRKANGGQASALNAGMALCEGDVVMFLDADDVLRPEAAACVAAAFAGDESLVKVQYRMEVIDAEGRLTGAVKPARHLPMPSGDLRAAELAFPFDIGWTATTANAFRTQPLRAIFPIPEGAYPVNGADWHLVHLAALLGPVLSLEEVLAYYRVHGGNSYEPQMAELDLSQIRQSIGFARSTASGLLGLASELGLPHPDRILSVADLANRLISLRLEPQLHPVPGERTSRLLGDAIRAVRRRSNVSATMKVAFVAWFAAMAIAPKPVARHLAALFLFPGRRTALNGLLGRLQRVDRRGATAAS